MKFALVLVVILSCLACNPKVDYRTQHSPEVWVDAPKKPVQTPWGLMSYNDYQELMRLKRLPREERKSQSSGGYVIPRDMPVVEPPPAVKVLR